MKACADNGALPTLRATDFMSLLKGGRFLQEGRHYGTLRSTDFLRHPPTTRAIAGAGCSAVLRSQLRARACADNGAVAQAS